MNPIIFKSILEALNGEPPVNKKLLDASCGSGLSSRAYRDLGYQVTPTNYNPSSFSVKDMTCLKVDLNQTWPFGDAGFD
jgi:hypothetical protein